MLRFSVLASSSKGNATVISSGKTSLLVDAGISATRIRTGLKECGLELPKLAGLCLTHEHHDHICGLGVLVKRGPLPIFCTRHMRQELLGVAPHSPFTCLEPGQPVQIGDITVTAFCTSHDAIDPVGFLFESGEKRLGYVTDTGRIMREMRELLRGVDALYLESNYDPDMLKQSQRPRMLIDRIAGRWGHLSNSQASDFVRDIAHEGLRHIVLAHLSEECNTPQLALSNMQHTVAELGLPAEVRCAPAANRLPWIELS
ncbi:MAG TPA: MBL fold metallo-hydrolase [Candidatus Akkermansia intestinigallinarum]|uniref:MBL fold metallo-hydrolase n=1 Tax=Candidatus Akkermansia intestinigallinarum TaxID=2838431 RepID=A0A9D1VB16_9BACT|nr:MBL fold metallo-hydrolase [Candidatus Akkermansia intestinigallinarum]